MSESKNIVIASDHAGVVMKKVIVDMLKEQGYEVNDLGPFNEDSVDYPDYAHSLAEQIQNGKADFGILMCGSGNGVAMTANKHSKVRAAVSWNDELAALARQHNNANVLSLPARFIDTHAAKKMVSVFLTTEFEGGRHEKRVNKIGAK
ncbi:MAG: ribose 5-phosphate isomerase B [Bacteroidetes bacterium]|nr:ribose 5-phosphate isomerase B [Bacteroidota bacterium]